MLRSALWAVADQLADECRASPDGGQWQAMVSVRTSIVPPGPRPPLADTPGTSPAATTPQVTASIHDFAGSLPFGGAVAVPVTRVFSPYVVQAGWARPRVRAGLLLQRSTGLVRRSGRPGESCPGLSAR
jgi:hypothetical protein